MKKYVGSILLSLVVGVYLGKFMLNQYDDFQVVPVMQETQNLYFLQQGVYSSLEVMKENMVDFSYYIYNIEDDGYHTYVGITKNENNADKIKEYFQNKGYDIYVKEIGIDNSVFVSVVEQYDLLLSEASGDTIDNICNQVLSSYEELVVGEN